MRIHIICIICASGLCALASEPLIEKNASYCTKTRTIVPGTCRRGSMRCSAKAEKTQVCCEGYERNSRKECVATCTAGCPNGKCVKPNVCECNVGYKIVDNKCLPNCTDPCIHGKCTAPQTCKCDDGYRMNSFHNTCKPICDSECRHGWCDKPNICGCDQGYELNDSNRCIPICQQPCINGKCVRPNECDCLPGFGPFPNDTHNCQPICTRKCIFGKCTAPETCTCDEGYKMDKAIDRCMPSCDSGCTNGRCHEPNICVCDEGFKKAAHDAALCRPICIEPCVFGHCTSPNTCSCNDGYKLAATSSNICIPVCSKTCINGSCIAPDECKCNDGFIWTSNSTYVCEPFCQSGCPHGVCVAPNKCVCNEGYAEDLESRLNTSTCKPSCNTTCEHGDCTAPNFCECDKGYIYNETSTSCDPVCSQGCINAFCESPETCTCLEGYNKSRESPNICTADCKNCINGVCVLPNECRCNDGFFMDGITNGFCIPNCEASCIHGACAVAGCNCTFGWGGKACDEPEFCMIPLSSKNTIHRLTQFTGIEHFKTAIGKINNYLFTKVENVTMKMLDTINVSEEMDRVVNSSEITWDGPSCDRKCADEFNETAIRHVQFRRTIAQHFFDFDIPCNQKFNSSSVLIAMKYLIDGMDMFTIVLSVAIISMGILILCSVRICKRKKNTSLDKRYKSAAINFIKSSESLEEAAIDIDGTNDTKVDTESPISGEQPTVM